MCKIAKVVPIFKSETRLLCNNYRPISLLSISFHACFVQGVPWHSGNYRVWIHSQMHMWHDKKIQSNGKIIEKLIHLRLSLFLERPNCWYPFQFGFRLNFSTNNALMSIVEIIKFSLMMANTQLVYLLIWKKPLTLLTITYYLRN